MAEVLMIPPSLADDIFDSGSRRPSRDAAQNAVYIPSKAVQLAYPPTSEDIAPRSSASIPSSAPSSPRQHNNDSSSQTSLLSTPSSSLSLNDTCYEQEAEEHGEPYFPSYQSEDGCHFDVPPSSPFDNNGDAVASTPVEDSDSNHEEAPFSIAPPSLTHQSVGDDIALSQEPLRHVDYLSHEWKEEDIWCSWRHIVSRRNQLENSQRLENASWRTWAKSRDCLKTVSPEKLNWMKDHDVTWLYGPLQTLNPQSIFLDSSAHATSGCRKNQFLSKKPILKKRSVSEVMLRRSLSNSTLVRQAVDALATQDMTRRESRSSTGAVAEPDHGTGVPAASLHREMPREPLRLVGVSSSSSGVQTPGCEKKHIHFNNEVEQCIAINKDNDEADDSHWPHAEEDSEDELSDDGMIMMSAERGKERKLDQILATHRGSLSGEQEPNKTIAMLPSTTLKYRGDTPEPLETSIVRGAHNWPSDRMIVHSSSSETLRPTRPSSNFLLDDDDDEDIEVAWQPRSKSIMGHQWAAYSQRGLSHGELSNEDENPEAKGLRRTPSGMLMPDEGDEGAEATGLVGKVLDTVNTARDIAHVIWNVGWRR